MLDEDRERSERVGKCQGVTQQHNTITEEPETSTAPLKPEAYSSSRSRSAGHVMFDLDQT